MNGHVEFPAGVVDAIIAKAMQEPYFHIGKDGDTYMERYWLVKPVDKGAPGTRIHRFLRSDADETYHDHPFDFTTVILRGSYLELTPRWNDWGRRVNEVMALVSPGDVVVRQATDLHRVILPPGVNEVWTMCMTGPIVRRWGFLTDPDKRSSWMHWKDFIARDGATPTDYHSSADNAFRAGDNQFDSVDRFIAQGEDHGRS